MLSARLIGTVALALPLALSGRLRLIRPRRSRSSSPRASARCSASISFTLGARHGIAVAAVLSSQFAAIAGVAAYFLFGERLSRIQLVGVCTVIAGVALLSGLRA